MSYKYIPRPIIDLVNIKLGIQSEQAVFSERLFEEFKNIKKGVPLLLPAEKDLFTFDKNDTFNINQTEILKNIYNTKNQHYEGFKHSFKNFVFLSKFKLKSSYFPIYNHVLKYNLKAIKKIKFLKTKYNRLGAFQSRNVPHFGHQKIIEMMLDNCDHLVINPVIGPKKKGDVLLENLEDIFLNILTKKYKYKISFIPYYANMFYAGPREAVHHSLLRMKLGFTHFTVGRDHAGAANEYNPDLATSLLNSMKSEIDINVITHNGAYFCLKCNQVVLKDNCKHRKIDLVDISGSTLRNSLRKNQIYKFADKDLQTYIINNKGMVFND